MSFLLTSPGEKFSNGSPNSLEDSTLDIDMIGRYDREIEKNLEGWKKFGSRHRSCYYRQRVKFEKSEISQS